MKHDVKPCYDILKPCYDILKPYYEILIMLTFDYKSYISTLWISVSMGFRSPLSGRMAVWLWFRCVFGPQLQRIHRSQEQPLTEGRTGRRVWLFTLFAFKHGRTRKFDSIISLGVDVAATTFRSCQVSYSYPVANITVGAKWMDVATVIRVSFNRNIILFPPTAARTAAWHVFLNSATLNWPC